MTWILFYKKSIPHENAFFIGSYLTFQSRDLLLWLAAALFIQWHSLR